MYRSFNSIVSVIFISLSLFISAHTQVLQSNEIKSLNGQKAINQLKQKGEFNSLKDAVYKTTKINNIDNIGSTPILNEMTEVSSRDDVRMPEDNFGRSIAIDGNTAVVAMPSDDEGAPNDSTTYDSGTVYVFVKSGSSWIQQAKLNASDKGFRKYFGSSVAISGDTIVIGSPGASRVTTMTDSGAAYVFKRFNSIWSEEAKLTASDQTVGNLFGESVAIDGNTVVVGAIGDIVNDENLGAAYVYTRVRTNWSERRKLTASDAEGGDDFGRSVAIEGTTIAIGSSRNDRDTDDNEGVVYIFTGNNASWTERVILRMETPDSGSRFGISLDLSGNTIVVGAYLKDYLYVFTGSGSNWTQQAKLTAIDNSGHDFFGESVAIDGNTIVAGAPDKDLTGQNSGSAYVFKRVGSSWSQQQQLNPADNAIGDKIGSSVAIDGDKILLGAPRKNDVRGAAYEYNSNGNSWTEGTKFIPSAGAFDEFGYSVAIQGNTAVIGAFRDDDNGLNSGTAYVFVKTAGTWVQQAILTASDGEEQDLFGSSVALFGDTVVVGASNANVGRGAVYIFTRVRSIWTEKTKLTPSDRSINDNFGISVGISGDVVIVGAYGNDDNGTDSGSAYIFTEVDLIWREQKITPADGSTSDWFGICVAINNNNAVIGAYRESSSGENSGAAYIFSKNGSNWNQEQKLTASDATQSDNFGFSVGVSGTFVIIGARGDADNGSLSGSAYIFENNNSTWTEQSKLLATDGEEGDYFGNSVGISGDTAIVGAFWDDDSGSRSGSAYVFTKSNSNWTEYRKLLASNGTTNDFFGKSVAISGSRAIVGASGKDVFPVSYTYNEIRSNFYEENQGSTYFFDIPDQPVAPAGSTKFDFDGDSKTDVSIFRPNVGEWWVLKSSDGGNFATQFGASTDKIIPADYTGDGKTDIAFFRPSNNEWFILRSEDSSFYSFQFGANGDIPAPGDFDGDGKADVAVFRPASATWFIIRSSDGGTDIINFGIAEDKPVVADYDGDGKDDIAIFRPSVSEWWINRSTAGNVAYQFGTSGDKTVQGDYTGDGKADVAIWRPSNGTWLILRSEDSSFYGFEFGINGDVPSPGDFDGDGQFDAAVFRPSNVTWYINGSTSGTQIVGFGVNGDIPLPNAYSVP